MSNLTRAKISGLIRTVRPLLATLLILLLAGLGVSRLPAAVAPAVPPATVGVLGVTAAIEFEGNATFSARALRDGLEGVTELLLAAHPSAPLDPYLATVHRALVRGYRNAGFPGVQITVTAEPAQKKVRVKITEGARFHHGAIVVTGTSAVPTAAIVRALSAPPAALKAGDRLQQAIERVLGQRPGREARQKAREEAARANAAAPSATGAISPGAAANDLALASAFDNAASTDEAALWVPGEHASFRDGMPDEIATKVRATLAAHGYPLAEVTVASEPDAATHLVRLAVRVTEGPRATVGTITIRGNERNTAEEILAATGLASGAELTPAVLAKAKLSLWNSARFFAFDLDLRTRAVRGREIDVTVDLVENGSRPPLREPLARAEAALVRFANWMTSEAAQRGFALTGTVGGKVPFSLAMAPEKGIAFNSISADGAQFALLMSPRRGRALVAANGRVATAEFNALTTHVDGFMTFITHDDPEKTGKHLSMNFGAGFSGAGTDPVTINLIVSPAFACEALLRDSTATFDSGDLVVTAKDGRLVLRCREATGEVIDWRGFAPAGDDEAKAADAPEMRFRRGTEEFAQIEKSVAAAAPAASTPRVSFAPLLMAHPLITRFLKSDETDASAQTTLAKFTLGALTIERLLATPSGQAWLLSGSTPEPNFSIPDDPNAPPQPGGFAAVLTGGYYKIATALWSAETWPAKLGRELFYIATGNAKYTGAVMDELYHDQGMGPVGCILAAQLLRTLEPTMASLFAQQAVERGTAEAFRRDWRMLFDDRSEFGRIAQDIVRSLADFDERDLAGITKALPGEEAALVQRAFAALRAASERPVVDVIQPFLDELWNRHLRPNLPERIAALTAEKPPVDAAGFNARGELRFQRGEFDAAKADFDKAIELNPNDAIIYGNRGSVRLDMRDPDGALADASRAIELNPKLARPYAVRGWIKNDRGFANDAIADCNIAISLNPSDVLAFTVRGNAKRRTGDLFGAIADHTRAIELVPGIAQGYYNRAGAKVDQRDFDGAIADCNRAIELNPAAVIAFQNRAVARLCKGDRAGAAADLDRAIELEPTKAAHYENRGKFREEEAKDFAGAIADFSKALELTPSNPWSYNGRGFARQAIGDLDGAISDYTQAIQLRPDFAGAFTNRGNTRRTARDFARAITDYNEAIRLQPANAAALLGRGYAYEGTNDFKAAGADFNRVIQLDPKSADAFNGRGHARSAQGDSVAALADYNQAIALSPRFAAAFNNRGAAKRALDDLAGALADFDEAITLSPQFANAFSHRGSTRLALGDLAGAVADFDKTVEYATNSHPSQLLRFTCQQRLHRTPSTAEFAAAIGSWEEGWNKTLGRFLMGELKADGLLRRAARSTGRTAESRLCDAHYFIGVAELLAGRVGQAREHFEKCLAKRRPDVTTFIVARAELRRLGNPIVPR